MAEWLKKELESLGAHVETRDLGKQVLDGQELDLPPALLAQLGNDPSKVSAHAHLRVHTHLTDSLRTSTTRKLCFSTVTLTFSLPKSLMDGCTTHSPSPRTLQALEGSTVEDHLTTRDLSSDGSMSSKPTRSLASTCPSTSRCASRGWRRVAPRVWTS